ncbi:MAG TPA: S8 family serine peptidase [Dongiaceae bacterium]|nr:S8 family serine peptidase [Dongiaceae bacterium]
MSVFFHSARRWWLGCLLALLLWPGAGRAADSITWNATDKSLSAAVDSGRLADVLAKIAAVTGWQVYIEPDTTQTINVKFTDLPLGEGLRSLLGKQSFALVPQTNAPPRLYVFHTSLSAATQMLGDAGIGRPGGDTSQPIPNQLVVTVKPGTDIEALARQLGAKIIGRVPGLNTYLLEFPDAASAAAARVALTSNADVTAVDYNYRTINVPPVQQLMAASSPFNDLKVKPATDGSQTVILIDTPVDAQNACNLSGYLLPGISVAGPAAASNGSPPHGASMAETIVLAAGGNVKIRPVDVYGSSETTTTFNVANGIYQGINAGGTLVNLSLASAGDSAFLHQVIQQAAKQGVAFYAAAGNEPVSTPMYPAAYPEVVSVTAGNRDGTLAGFANRSSTVDVVGPSGSVVCYDGNSWLVTGTSASAAWLSGQTAAVAGNNPGTSMTQVQTVVVQQMPKPKD